MKFSCITTCNTHKDRYSFLHMAFSLKMSQDVFQMCMDQVTDCLARIIAVHNDVCICSQTADEYGRHLILLMQTILKNGIIFKSSKCRIRQPEISIYSTVLTPQGMKCNPAKVQDPQDLPISDNQMKFQSFLGLINYLQPLIPGLADNTTFLQEQPSG